MELRADKEAIQAIVRISDAALRSQGMAVFPLIQALNANTKPLETHKEEPRESSSDEPANTVELVEGNP